MVRSAPSERADRDRSRESDRLRTGSTDRNGEPGANSSSVGRPDHPLEKLEAGSAAGYLPGSKPSKPSWNTRAFTERLHARGIRPKLEMSTAGGPLEREADALAGSVLSMSDTATGPSATESDSATDSPGDQPTLGPQQSVGSERLAGQKQSAALAAGRATKTAQSPATRGLPGGGAPSAAVGRLGTTRSSLGAEFEHRLERASRGGRPLPRTERVYFEPRFGVDLRNVTVHTDAEANRLAASIGARAFTGPNNHIYFGSGYDVRDRELLAHELAHIYQTMDGRTESVVARMIQPNAAVTVTQSTWDVGEIIQFLRSENFNESTANRLAPYFKQLVDFGVNQDRLKEAIRNRPFDVQILSIYTKYPSERQRIFKWIDRFANTDPQTLSNAECEALLDDMDAVRSERPQHKEKAEGEIKQQADDISKIIEQETDEVVARDHTPKGVMDLYGASSQVNSYLRSVSGPLVHDPNYTDPTVSNLAVNTLKGNRDLTAPRITYRRDTALNNVKSVKKIKIKEGDIVSDFGFMSTSANRIRLANEPTSLITIDSVILGKSGVPFIYSGRSYSTTDNEINKWFDLAGEAEILYPRKTNFRVRKVRKYEGKRLTSKGKQVKQGYLSMVLEEIGGDSNTQNYRWTRIPVSGEVQEDEEAPDQGQPGFRWLRFRYKTKQFFKRLFRN